MKGPLMIWPFLSPKVGLIFLAIPVAYDDDFQKYCLRKLFLKINNLTKWYVDISDIVLLWLKEDGVCDLEESYN